MLKFKEDTVKKKLKIHVTEDENISTISRLSDGAERVMYCANIGGLENKTTVDTEGVTRCIAAYSKINGI